MPAPLKYNPSFARPLAEAGMSYHDICKQFGWDPYLAQHVRRTLRREGHFGSAKPRQKEPLETGSRAAAAPCEEVPLIGKAEAAYVNDRYNETEGTWDAVRLSERCPRSLEELVEIFKVDTRVWEVVSWEPGVQEMMSVPRPKGSSSGGWENLSPEPVVTTLYRIKAKFRRSAALAVRSALEGLAEDLSAKMQFHAPRYAPLTYKSRSAGGVLLEPCIFDVHLGKLAWAEESGGHYDLRLAEARYEDAVSDILHSCSVYDVERIVLPLGHDFFHVDDRENRTHHGTVVTADSRQQKVFRLGCDVIVAALDRLRLVAPVDVVMVPGNHDTASIFSLGEFLSAWYRKDSAVTVDNRAALRKYYEYGSVMLQFTHGSEESTAVAASALAAAEEPAMWGRTKYRESHQGHRHQKKGVRDHLKRVAEYQEHLGFITRTISALSETDAWHFEKAFVGNIQGAEAFVWDAERGLKAHHFYTVPDHLI